MRTFLLVSSIFLSLFCLAGCSSQTALTQTLRVTQAPAQVQTITPEPASTQTATLEPSSTPTYTPSVSPTEPFTATPTPETQVFDYPSYGFRLTLPPGYQWAKQPVEGDFLLSLGIKQKSDTTSGYTLAPIGLRVFEKPAKVNLIDWFSEKQGDCYERGGEPPAGVYFIDPIVEDQADFQDMPALQYESGCWPVPYEIVIDRGRLVITLYYLRDYPIDSEADFNQILASLEFYEPALPIAESPAPPTPTATVCLDDQAEPLDVPARQVPLEVRFRSDGNIWTWEEAGSAQQISDTGDAVRFTFSPDGEVIAFERPVGDYPDGQYKIELWGINRNGEGLRRLVSAEQFDAFLPERHEAWMANVPIDYRWFPDTHKLSFGVYAYVNAVGGGSAAEGYWVVDVDTLALEKWDNPEAINPDEPIKIAAPDGKVIALVDRSSISLLNADGSIIRNDVLTYPANNCGEGPCWSAPSAFWTSDSLFLRVLVWDENPDESFSAWQLPADGSPAQKLHTFSGMFDFIDISPNQVDIAYLRRVRPMSNDHELHLAKFDGSQDVTYTAGYEIYFWGWVPDSFHFVYGQFNLNQPFLGSLCGGSVPLVDPSETPASQITWVDANRFLFVSGGEGQPRQLRLGQVGRASIWIGPFNGDSTYYEIKPDP